MKDKNDIELSNGDIIDLHQTINGENLFIVLDIENLDIRYAYEIRAGYQYDKKDLLSPSKLTGEVDFEIVGNIYTYIKSLR